MLEQGQGLYFTPKRARKFKVETIFNLSPGPQQSTYRDAVPSPTYGNLITMGQHQAGNQGVIVTTTQWKRSLPASPSAGVRITSITPLHPKGNRQGSCFISFQTPYSRAILHKDGRLQRQHPSSERQLGHTQRKGLM